MGWHDPQNQSKAEGSHAGRPLHCALQTDPGADFGRIKKPIEKTSLESAENVDLAITRSLR